MGCVASAFQFGSYVVPEGAQVVNEHHKRDEEQRWSYNSPDETPLLKPSAVEGKEFQKVLETKLHIEKPASCYSSSPSPESLYSSEPNEVQRVHDTKLERERITNESGATTEKTQYTQYVESTKFQEFKGPVSDPFDSISHATVFPSSSPLVRTPDPTSGGIQHEIVIEKSDEPTDVTDAVVKIQAGVRGYLTRKALKDKHKDEKLSESDIQEDEPLIVLASTNHSLDETVSRKENQVIDVFPEAVTVHSTAIQPVQVSHASALEDQHVEIESQAQAATKIQAAFRGYKVRKEKRKVPIKRNHNNSDEVKDEECEESEGDESEECEESEEEVESQGSQVPAPTNRVIVSDSPKLESTSTNTQRVITVENKLKPVAMQSQKVEEVEIECEEDDDEEEEEEEEEDEEDEEEEVVEVVRPKPIQKLG